MRDWLKQQKAYQESVYGIDYGRMWREDTVVNYVSVMLTAAQLEVAEAFQEVPWKPWAQLGEKARTIILSDRSAKVTGEIVDVLFFLSNALVALDVSDDDLTEAYAAKMGVNRQRQVDGYDGVSTKCPGCGRALDDVAVTPVQRNGVVYCSYGCSVKDQGEEAV